MYVYTHEQICIHISPLPRNSAPRGMLGGRGGRFPRSAAPRRRHPLQKGKGYCERGEHKAAAAGSDPPEVAARIPRPAPPRSAVSGQTDRHPEVARGRRARPGMPAAGIKLLCYSHPSPWAARGAGDAIPAEPPATFPDEAHAAVPAQKLVGTLTQSAPDCRIHPLPR